MHIYVCVPGGPFANSAWSPNAVEDNETHTGREERHNFLDLNQFSEIVASLGSIQLHKIFSLGHIHGFGTKLMHPEWR